MTRITGDIRGGDYASAGSASKEIKTALKRIGVAPATVRRAMVAVYEAEMNVVIHARAGHIHAAVTPKSLEVQVSDTGPGISDIAEAMREGYSTAPPEARELGFGAGMGLPNIRKNTDRFSIHSEVNKGTQLQFAIRLTPQYHRETYTASVSIAPEKCKHCLRCLHVCPTQAIRIRDGAPMILPPLCIDCTACRAHCPAHVYGIKCPATLPDANHALTLHLPAPMRGQFGEHVSEKAFRKMLEALGWERVWLSDGWERALAAAVQKYAHETDSSTLLLPPVCPAVINLIQVRYPALLKYVAPFFSALEAARESLQNSTGIFVTPCAALCTLACQSSVLQPCSAVSPEKLLRSLTAKHVDKRTSPVTPVDAGSMEEGATVTITGIERVCQFLDEAEEGRVDDCGIANLYACDSGCYGAPVWPEHPEVSRHRSRTTAQYREPAATAMYRPKPLEARAGMRLDPDMKCAIQKLAKIDRVRAALPGRDCGVCGSPTCMALAEDIVMGRAAADACVYSNRNDMINRLLSDEESSS